MADTPFALDAGTLTLNSTGGEAALVITYEEDGFFNFGPIPKVAKRFLQDRGKNTATQIGQPEEQVPFNFKCQMLDDQDVGDIRSLFDGTKHVQYAVTAGETFTFYYCEATVKVDVDAESGHTISVDGMSQGFSNGAGETYGLIPA